MNMVPQALSCLLLLVTSGDTALANLVTEQARLRMPAESVGLRVLRLQVPRGVPARVDPADARVEFREGEDFSGPSLVRLDFLGRTRWLSVDFELLVDTAVARTRLDRGHRLEAGDLEIKPLPRRLHSGGPPPAPDSLIGQVLTSAVEKGEPVLPRRLRRPVVIRRGDRVRLEVQGEHLVVHATGLAQAAGRVGDTIPVKSLASSKRLMAVVVGQGRVRIALDGRTRVHASGGRR
jgi:flagella basal body P-ring formation protein FlgA